LRIEAELVDHDTGEPLANHSLEATALFNGSPNPEVRTEFQDGYTGTTDDEGHFRVSVNSFGSSCDPPAPVLPDELVLRVTRHTGSGGGTSDPQTCEVQIIVSFADSTSYEIIDDYGPNHPTWLVLEPIQVPACGEE
jgi:hypothetical protein